MSLTGTQSEALLATLPTLQRLALAYAPARARVPTLALLALDTRMASLLRNSREPMLAQLRLAWWRETLQRDASEWPVGEPILQALGSWQNGHGALTALVDGWEALTSAAPLPAVSFETMAEGRGAAFAALAGVVGTPTDVEGARALGKAWALADLSARLSHPAEQEAAHQLRQADQSRYPSLSRAMRPLVVLHGLAQRELVGEGRSRASLLTALRLGWFGR